MGVRAWRELAWIAVPFAAYLAVLQGLWFDAPVLDDYYIALANVMSLQDARSPADWLGIVLAQHAEHRVAVVRIAAWAIAAVAGQIDLRILTLVGNLTVLGLALLAWAQFRHALAAPFVGAAAILLMQWSYYEASIMATAALPNIGVVFFSSACLYFATRTGRGAAVAALLCGLLAAGSQTNGLFALPLAAVGALLVGRRRPATVFAVAALVLWAAFFWTYERPSHYPSPFLALAQPLAAMRYFLMVTGGVVPGRWAPMAVGVAILASVAWLTWRGTWKRFPAAGLCVVFVLLSGAAIAAGRVVFGTQPSPRYAIYPTWLLVIVLLAAGAELRWTGRPLEATAVAGAIVAAVFLSWLTWTSARELSRAGRMLMKALPADERIAVPDPYPWTLHPGPQESRGILAAAERRGLYVPPRRVVHAPALRTAADLPSGAEAAGAIDEVVAVANRVKVSGWSPVPATIAGTVILHGGGEPVRLARYELAARPDIAMIRREPALVASGFRLELEYPSHEAARHAAGSLCLGVEAPGRRPALLSRAGAPCAGAAAR